MRTARDDDIAALIAFLRHIALGGFDTISTRCNQSGIAALNFDTIVSFEGVVNTSYKEREVLDLQVILGMNAVIIFGNYGKRTLATDLQINIGVDCARIECFIRLTNSSSHIVNIVLGILFCFDRNLVTTLYRDGVRGVTDE